jgi:glycerol dehydrogenase
MASPEAGHLRFRLALNRINPRHELLEMVAQRATAAGETIHNEPFPVTPALVAEAMRAADFRRRRVSE